MLNTEVTDELRREGIAKDLIRNIQNQRKEIGCQYTDRIAVGVATDDDDVAAAIDEHRPMICGETLADRLETSAIPGADAVETEFGQVYVLRLEQA